MAYPTLLHSSQQSAHLKLDMFISKHRLAFFPSDSLQRFHNHFGSFSTPNSSFHQQ
jgi:hypothetical protein